MPRKPIESHALKTVGDLRLPQGTLGRRVAWRRFRATDTSGNVLDLATTSVVTPRASAWFKPR